MEVVVGVFSFLYFFRVYIFNRNCLEEGQLKFFRKFDIVRYLYLRKNKDVEGEKKLLQVQLLYSEKY